VLPALAILVGYGLGSIPFALLLARRWGTRNLHQAGSGNLGAANVFRVSGPAAGVIVALLDIAKGAASVWVAKRLTGGAEVPAAAGLAAIVGHIYPVWLRFRGGKGVATACGVFAVLTPIAVVTSCLLFVAAVWVTKYISLGSIVASASLPPVAFAVGNPMPSVLMAIGAATLIVFRHRSNLARMRRGSERRIGARAS
jgi:glycerol-3-phosphate acyltransferase PlsY